MIQRQNSAQLKQEFVCIEDMVPKDHLLRKIDRHINFSFIYDKTKDLYSKVFKSGSFRFGSGPFDDQSKPSASFQGIWPRQPIGY